MSVVYHSRIDSINHITVCRTSAGTIFKQEGKIFIVYSNLQVHYVVFLTLMVFAHFDYIFTRQIHTFFILFLKKKINVVFSLRKKSMLFFIDKSKHPFSPILFLFIASLSFARIACKLITIRHISWSDSGYL